MRRLAAVRARRDAQAAIYDGLLFLMVVILISVGMFLWSAKLVADGPAFSGATYQDLAADQLVTVLGLNVGAEGINVSCTNSSGTFSFELASAPNVSAGIRTVDWALRAHCALRDWALWCNGTFRAQGLPPAVDAAFARAALDGTHYAWTFVVGGEAVMWGSDDTTMLGEGDLPTPRCAEERTLCTVPSSGEGGAPEPLGVVRYYLWLA